MLNFTTLQSLRYNGLNLLTLVDQIKKIYNVRVSQLIESLDTAETVVSWKQYMIFSKAMMIETNQDKKWMFAREFDPSVFIHISYNENTLLCNLAAAMIDYSKSGTDNWTARNPGPTYSGITSLRPNATQLGDIGFGFAREAHDYLKLQFSFRGINEKSRRFIKNALKAKVTCQEQGIDEDDSEDILQELINRQP